MGLLDRVRRGLSPERARVGVIGLDGVGLPLVRTLTERGVMPRLAAFMASGSTAPMKSTIPTISSVSWAGFLTGNNPGRHGIYGFTDIEPVEFRQYFPNFRHMRCPTVFDLLAEQGRRSVVVNVPGTYPAREMNGVLISGFVAIKLEKAVYPAALLPRLEQANYKIDVDYVRANERPDEFFRDLVDTLEIRRRVLLDLMRDDEWDLFVGVVTETDRLHHYYWHVWEDSSSPYHERFVEFYAKLDGVIGDLLDGLGDTPAVILADHGHMLIESEFYPNAWLRDHGYLAYKTDPPRTIADIDPSTRAFVLDPGRVYVNVKGRYPTGSVDPGDAAAVLQEVLEGLQGVTYDGRRPVSRVYARDELYSGDRVDFAPDAVLHFTPGFDIKGSLRATEAFGRSALTGMHTYDDSLFCASTSEMDLAGMDIIDVAPTLLGALGMSGGDALDGRDRGLR